MFLWFASIGEKKRKRVWARGSAQISCSIVIHFTLFVLFLHLTIKCYRANFNLAAFDLCPIHLLLLHFTLEQIVNCLLLNLLVIHFSVKLHLPLPPTQEFHSLCFPSHHAGNISLPVNLQSVARGMHWLCVRRSDERSIRFDLIINFSVQSRKTLAKQIQNKALQHRWLK